MKSFQPPVRTLMGPGPSDVHPRVTDAMSRPTIGHLDPRFVEMTEEIKDALRGAFRTANTVTFPISGPGSAGMEACFVNLIEPGDTAVICENGVFGRRMTDSVERLGGTAAVVQSEWGKPVDIDEVADALKAAPHAKILAFVHAETSTGVLSDARSLCRLAHEHDCLSVMDCVTSVGGVPVDVDAWGADAAYTGTQKCLSCPPGLSPVTFGSRAVETVRRRKTKVRSWFLDLPLQLGYWEGDAERVYHHTAPVNALYGLHEALLMLHEEGLAQAWARHRRMHDALKAGLTAMGIDLFVEEAYRLPQLNAVTVPHGVDEAEVRRALLADYDLEIGAGLGGLAGKIWRIGLMGHSARTDNVLLCLKALESTLSSMQAPIEKGGAVTAAKAVLTRNG